MTQNDFQLRPQVTLSTIEDEFVNGVTHGIGLLMAIGGLCSLLVLTLMRGNAWHIVGCAIYGVSLVTLYAASTAYHFAQQPRLKYALQICDHIAIFLLIAGTYTPFTLVNLRGPWGWFLFALVWSVATAGVAAKAIYGDRWRWVSLSAYIGMGWCGVIAAKPMFQTMPYGAIGLLLGGGLAYTFGTIFYALDHVRYFHAVWHFFVILGSALHFCAVLIYVVPSAIY